MKNIKRIVYPFYQSCCAYPQCIPLVCCQLPLPKSVHYNLMGFGATVLLLSHYTTKDVLNGFLSQIIVWNFTSGYVCAYGTYLIFLPSSNDVIYFSSKNNTRLSFPSIKQWCQLLSFQTNNNVKYERMHVQRKLKYVKK